MGELLMRIGWSQRHFARVLGISVDTVGDWCADRTDGPGKKAAEKYLEVVVRVLGV